MDINVGFCNAKEHGDCECSPNYVANETQSFRTDHSKDANINFSCLPSESLSDNKLEVGDIHCLPALLEDFKSDDFATDHPEIQSNNHSYVR